MVDEIAVIIPVYNNYIYARRACLSLFKYSEIPCHALVVDDASPEFSQVDWSAWYKDLPEEKITYYRFKANGGLTRSWNWGLQAARERGSRYAVCGNSDILFTPNWDVPLTYHADKSCALVGPVSNAPGMTNKGRQSVQKYFPGYRVTDDPEYLARVSAYLKRTYPKDTVVTGVSINGFFMLASTKTWWEGAFDEKHVFDPRKRMTGNEDELQRRWHRRKMRSGFVPTSFIFHYRSVSRGSRFRSAGWHRLRDANKPV